MLSIAQMQGLNECVLDLLLKSLFRENGAVFGAQVVNI